MLVIYHAGCMDGFCAAWLIHRQFPDAEFCPANYGDDPPDCAGKDVVIADFSYKRHVMLSIIDECKSLVVLDHHKTAKGELEGLEGFKCQVTFDMDKSGARLTQEWLCRYTDQSPEYYTDWLVDYTEDRDLWRHKLTFSKEINAAIRVWPLDFDHWGELAELHHGQLSNLVIAGASILSYQAKVVQDHVGFARMEDIGGYRVPVVNATSLISEIAGALAVGHPFGACYFDRGDGLRIWSLRSTPEGIDVSEVARQYGGGGHKHAAGFQFLEPGPVL